MLDGETMQHEFENEFEDEFANEYSNEYESEYENEEFLDSIGNMLGLGEGEYENEYESEEFIKIRQLGRKLFPVLKKIAPLAAGAVGTALYNCTIDEIIIDSQGGLHMDESSSRSAKEPPQQ